MNQRPLMSLCLCLVLSAPALAGELPAPPPDRVLDRVGALDPGQRQAVLSAIDALERDLGAEVGVLVTGSSHGEDSAGYARRVFNHWGVGKADADNGVLLTLLLDDRRVEVTPGDGYQSLFTRSRCQTLLERYVVPALERGQPGEAIATGVQELCDAVRMHEQGLSPTNLEAPPPPQRMAAPNSSPVTPRTAALSTPAAPPSDAGLGLFVVGLIVGIPALLGLAYLLRPRCPRCKETLKVRRHTLTSATYGRSGLGEKISTCRCGYRNRRTYRIPQKTHTTTTATGFGASGFGSGGGGFSGGGSSFGGGSSSGGGGGASW